MHIMSSDNLLLAERKAVCKPATIDITMRREETNTGTTQTRRSVEHCTQHADGAWLNELGWSQ